MTRTVSRALLTFGVALACPFAAAVGCASTTSGDSGGVGAGTATRRLSVRMLPLTTALRSGPTQPLAAPMRQPTPPMRPRGSARTGCVQPAIARAARTQGAPTSTCAAPPREEAVAAPTRLAIARTGTHATRRLRSRSRAPRTTARAAGIPSGRLRTRAKATIVACGMNRDSARDASVVLSPARPGGSRFSNATARVDAGRTR